MRNTNKKGFTIVELVVVVAVIAILAAVLIPTFSGVINKANMSADQKAVRDMNTALAIADVENNANTFNDAVNALLASNIGMEKYKALAKDKAFYWVQSLKRVVYVDKDLNVVYPTEYADVEYDIEDGWYSLSGEVKTSDAWKDNKNGSEVAIANGAELVSLMQAFAEKDADAAGITKVTLSADVDLMGAAVNFGKVTANVEFDGGNKTIYNLRNGASASLGNNNAANEPTSYGFGLFGEITKNKVVEVKNVTFDGVAINGVPGNGAVAAGHAGVVAGKIDNGGKLIVTNVTISNCTVATEKKAGALVGYIEPGANLEVNGLTVSNVEIFAGREAAAVIGYLQCKRVNKTPVATVSITDLTVTNVTVSHDASYGYTLSNDGSVATKDGEDNLGITSMDCWYIYESTKEGKNYHN